LNVSEAIRTKRAIREFADQALPDQVVTAILDAGRRSQSSKNTQPWHFIAIRDRDTLRALSQLGAYAGHLAGAPLGVVIVTPPLDPGGWIMFDAGQAAAYMQLAAWGLGVGSCIASIYEPQRARELLGVPAGMELHVAISFGYPAASASQPRRARPGGRRPLDEVVHWDRW
jgi:nitroreductase